MVHPLGARMIAIPSHSVDMLSNVVVRQSTPLQNGPPEQTIIHRTEPPPDRRSRGVPPHLLNQNQVVAVDHVVGRGLVEDLREGVALPASDALQVLGAVLRDAFGNA